MSPKKIRLMLGWLGVPVFLLVARPTLTCILAGLALTLVGAAVRAWAAGTISKNRVLAVSGPYAFTRNPLYCGTFLIGTGLCVASGQLLLLPVFFLLFAWIYGWNMRIEARHMETRFGPAYRRYAEHVPLFVPRLTPYRGGDAADSFELRRYLRNGEHQAALGIVLGFLALLAKMALS